MRKRPPSLLRLAGFTLIELLVVLAIVATLLLLVAPRYTRQIETSKEAALRDNLRVVRQVIDNFYGDKGRYPESLQELVDLQYLRALPVDPISESATDWRLVDVPAGQEGRVYDIHSGSTARSSSGEAYSEW